MGLHAARSLRAVPAHLGLQRIWATRPATGRLPSGPSSSSPSAGRSPSSARHPPVLHSTARPRQRSRSIPTGDSTRAALALAASHQRILYIPIPWLTGASSSLSPAPFAESKDPPSQRKRRRVHFKSQHCRRGGHRSHERASKHAAPRRKGDEHKRIGECLRQLAAARLLPPRRLLIIMEMRPSLLLLILFFLLD